MILCPQVERTQFRLQLINVRLLSLSRRILTLELSLELAKPGCQGLDCLGHLPR